MTGIGHADLRACAAALEAVRRRAPRVHCITNTVVQNITANMLLAFGAIPSMTINPEEVADFVGGADALLVNLGTVDGERKAAIPVALQAARDASKPVVLDPVFIDRSPGRAAFARELAAQSPTIIRANAAEWAVLVGQRPDAPDGQSLPSELQHFLQGSTDGAVGVLTGARDLLATPRRLVSFSGGHTLMARVTGIGCGQAAIMGALAACAETPFHGALAGLLIFALCGERAAARADGPGSFEPALLDALYAVTAADIQAMEIDV